MSEGDESEVWFSFKGENGYETTIQVESITEECEYMDMGYGMVFEFCNTNVDW